MDFFLFTTKTAIKNLLANKLRSFLTILGIIIGVASVIIIFAIGRSAQELILDQVRGIGSNLIAIIPGASDEKGPPAPAMGISITTLKYDDLLALKRKSNVPEVVDGAGYVMGTVTAEWRKESLNASLTGTTASYLNVENAQLAYGKFFQPQDDTNFSRIAVLGSQVAQDLFGYDINNQQMKNVLGRKIKINGKKFLVIGILAKRGSVAFGFSSQDDTIFIPLKTAQKIILGINHLGFIRLRIKDESMIASAKDHIKKTLRFCHHIDNSSDDDFSVRDQTSTLEMIGTITDVLRYFLLAVGSIALLVGGVGIMNIMLISVNQRIREIGLRKAIGARNSDVIIQFLLESVSIALVGGILGIILGLLTALIFSLVIEHLGYHWPFLISNWSIFIALIVSFMVGIVFGVYPARKAAQISPMEALRYE